MFRNIYEVLFRQQIPPLLVALFSIKGKWRNSNRGKTYKVKQGMHANVPKWFADCSGLSSVILSRAPFGPAEIRSRIVLVRFCDLQDMLNAVQRLLTQHF